MADHHHNSTSAHFAASSRPSMMRQAEDVRSAAAGIDCLLRIVAAELAAFNGSLRDQKVEAFRFADAGDWENFDVLLSVARDQLRRLVKLCNQEDVPIN